MDANPPNSFIVSLKKHMKDNGLTVVDLEKGTGISKEKVYKWLKKENPRINSEDAGIVERWINGQLDNIPAQKESGTDPLTNKSIQSLAESNKTLAESNRKLADAHFLIAQTNARLVDRALGVTEGGKIENAQETNGKMMKLLRYVAMVGSGQRWPDVESAGEALSNDFLGIEQIPLSEDKLSKSGK